MMIRDASGTSRTITGVYVRDANNVSRQVSAIMVRDSGNISRSVLNTAPAVSVSPQSVSGDGYSKTPIKVTTNIATVTAPQGATYAWTFADTGWTATFASGASSAFSHFAPAGTDFSTTATCTVTVNGKSSTVIVQAEVSNDYEGSGSGTV